MREVEGEKAREGNKERVIPVEEVIGLIVLNESGNKRNGRGRGMSGGRRMGCSRLSRGKGSVSRGLCGVGENVLREGNLLEASDIGFLEC